MPTIPIQKHYLSLGASNALGDSDPAGWVVGGYGPILLEKLKAYGAEEPYTNLAQNGERTSTFIKSW